MPLRIASESPGVLRVGTENVGVVKIASEVVYRSGPPPVLRFRVQPQGRMSTAVLWPNPQDGRAMIFDHTVSVGGVTFAVTYIGMAKDQSSVKLRIDNAPDNWFGEMVIRGVGGAFTDNTDAKTYPEADATTTVEGTVRTWEWGMQTARWRGGRVFNVTLTAPSA